MAWNPDFTFHALYGLLLNKLYRQISLISRLDNTDKYNDKFEILSSLSKVFSDNDTDIKQTKEIITTHLINLQTSFNTRFDDSSGKNLNGYEVRFLLIWMKEIKRNLKIKEKHIDLSSEKSLRIRI